MDPTPSAQQLADGLPDGVVVAAADATVVLVSAVAGRMLGVDPVGAVGRPLDEVLRLTDNEGRDWCAENQPFGGLATRTGVPEQSWLLPNGTEVLTTASIARPSRGAPVEQVAVVVRSGRGRARLDRERSDLVATVAHELRSPLTGVKGFVQAMLNRWDRLSDEQKKLMLTTVHADSDRLSRLIAELLDVARIDTGRLSLQPRPSDAAVLVGRVVDSVSAGSARPVALDAPDGLPRVLADPDKFTQVVTNVVENAMRHGAGDVTVSLSSLPDGADHPGVRIVVEDEGDGIPLEMRRRVFTKFWTGGARGGSGLGLYLVQGLTRAHGGSVVLGDADDGGARVTIEWPAADVPDVTPV
ncbi:ATP-binding protein [Nocardioides aestuarii]|uniref:histidine kinase n=1 Tax=Nocardioides aestuarii TaxID=252231 RepID=A0ABW4TK50_9ACTN